MLKTDPRFVTLLVSIRIFLLVFGSILATNHYGQSGLYHLVMAAAGGIMDLGTAAWGIMAAWSTFRLTRAQGVAAGINLVMAGAALDQNGEPVSAIASDATTPPLPVTLKSADQIVRSFAPAPAGIKKG